MPPSLHSARYWKEKADGARLVAGSTGNETSRQLLLRIAEQYEELARSYFALESMGGLPPDDE